MIRPREVLQPKLIKCKLMLHAAVEKLFWLVFKYWNQTTRCLHQNIQFSLVKLEIHCHSLQSFMLPSIYQAGAGRWWKPWFNDMLTEQTFRKLFLNFRIDSYWPPTNWLDRLIMHAENFGSGFSASTSYNLGWHWLRPTFYPMPLKW